MMATTILCSADAGLTQPLIVSAPDVMELEFQGQPELLTAEMTPLTVQI